MTESAVIHVHGRNSISCMAAGTECSGKNRSGMAVGMSDEIAGMTTGTRPFCNCCNEISVHRIRQGRGSRVTLGAGIVMNRHRIVSRMAACDTRRSIGNMTQSALPCG